LNIVLFIPRGC